MSSPIKPNFFIVGAVKCGTTSMYRYLGQHPDVFMPDVKEPYFFGTDLNVAPYWGVHDEAQYLALFGAAGAEARIGEASVWYLYSETAAREIIRFSPSARIIIMLRNPVDVLYSLHGQFLRSYNENIESFEEALAAEPDRRQGRRVPRSAHFPLGLHYRRVVHFAPQVQRYFDVFGPDRVHVVLLDDFLVDPSVAYGKTLGFLNVDAAFRPEFKAFNTYDPLVIRPSRRFWKTRRPLQRRVDRLIGSYPRGRIDKVMDWMSHVLDRPARMKEDTRARLQKELAGEIESLAALLQRDLSDWLTPATPPRHGPTAQDP